MVCELFDTKVDAIMDFGRWLFILVPCSQQRIDDFYDGWARTLLGADFWRNAGACASELGWQLSGFGRVVRSVALRRAKLWSLADVDWHASFFKMSLDLPGSWACVSGKLLEDWSIADWPSWNHHRKSMEHYKLYVDSVLATRYRASWTSIISRHRSHVPYHLFEPLPGTGIGRLQVHLPLASHVHVRSWCRLRCGLLCLSHLGGSRSAARFQDCIFCKQSVRNNLVHSLSLCPRWASRRTLLEEAAQLERRRGAQEFTLQCLRSDLPGEALICMLTWAAELDRGEYEFWRSHENEMRLHSIRALAYNAACWETVGQKSVVNGVDGLDGVATVLSPYSFTAFLPAMCS